MAQKLTKDEHTLFLETLRSVRDSSKLLQSSLANSVLVQIKKEAKPSLSTLEAFREVLDDILHLVQKENQHYATVLSIKFWEGMEISEILDSGRIWPSDPAERRTERTFLNHQRKAVNAFGFLFRHQEGQVSTSQSSARKPKRIFLYSALILLGVAVLLLIVFGMAPNLEKPMSYCGESHFIVDEPVGERFLPAEGVSSFTPENTPGVLNSRVRSVQGTPYGVIAGYYDAFGTGVDGISVYERTEKPRRWMNCNDSDLLADAKVNAILTKDDLSVWLATDGQGVLMFDGHQWQSFNPENSGLPHSSVFSLVLDKDQDSVWASTANGIAVFREDKWEAVYDNELFDNQVYTLAFDSNDGIWAGHISKGISYFNNETGRWNWFHSTTTDLPNDKIRGILVRNVDGVDEIWVGTAGGGVLKFSNGIWTKYDVEDGLPDANVTDIALDRFGRIWVATESGVVYLQDDTWVIYNRLHTHDISFVSTCFDGDCVSDDYVWTATEENGLTHSRLPYAEKAVEINRICFLSPHGVFECEEDPTESDDVIQVTYPFALESGDEFYFEIYVTPINGYALDESRGDFLRFAGGEGASSFGAYPIIPVSGRIETAQQFVFSNKQNMFVAPEIEPGDNLQSTPWRIWMHTRYVGPLIEIKFQIAE